MFGRTVCISHPETTNNVHFPPHLHRHRRVYRHGDGPIDPPIEGGQARALLVRVGGIQELHEGELRPDEVETWARRADTGLVRVNAPTAGLEPHVPFGGSRGAGGFPDAGSSSANSRFTSAGTDFSAFPPGPSQARATSPPGARVAVTATTGTFGRNVGGALPAGSLRTRSPTA